MVEGLLIGVAVWVVAFVLIFPAISAWESFDEVPHEVWEETRLEPFEMFLRRWLKPRRFPVSLLLSILYIAVLWPRLRTAGATHRPPWPWEAERVVFDERNMWFARRVFILTAVGVIAIVVTIVWWIRVGTP